MLCQIGHVSVRRGQWYRLKFRAKAQGIKAGAIEVAGPVVALGVSVAAEPAASSGVGASVDTVRSTWLGRAVGVDAAECPAPA